MARGRKKKDSKLESKKKEAKPAEIIEKPANEPVQEFVFEPEPVIESVPIQEEEPVPKEVRYFLAKGKSVTSRAGIIDEKESRKRCGIDASYFIGGQKTLENLVKRGVLVAE